MYAYKLFPQALTVVIEQRFHGSQTEFAVAAGITPATISRLCAGSREITRETLGKICRILEEPEQRSLCLAAVRDFLPEEGKKLIFSEHPQNTILVKENEIPYPKLDQETQDFLGWLQRDAAYNPETRAWLNHLAKWINPPKAS